MTTINPTEVQFPIHPRLIDGTVVDPKEIRVTVDGPERVTAEIRSKPDGTYVYFKTTTTGDYKITMTARGQGLQNGTVTVNVKERSGDEAPKRAALPAVNTYPVRFEVDAKDQNGKVFTGDVSVTVSGPEKVQPKVERRGDKLLISFDVTIMTGNYTVDVRHNGQHIQRSPFEITLTPKKEGGTSRSPEDDIVRLPPLPDTQEIIFKVPARMPDNKPVRAEELTVSLVKGPQPIKNARAVQASPDHLEIHFHAAAPGSYEIGVTKNGANIDDSPFSVDVPPEAFKK